MQSGSQGSLSAPMNPRPLRASTHRHRLYLLYACPDRVDVQARQLCEAATDGHVDIEVGRLRPLALARRARFEAFISPTILTVVVLCDRRLVGQAIGNPSVSELRTILWRAAEGARAVSRRDRLASSRGR